MSQIVYIFANPVMPGVVKIGKTDNSDVGVRMKQLFTTGVPVPFDCVCASVVDDNTGIEKLLHAKFAKNRINPKREFFWLSAKSAVKVLKAYEISDVTPDIRTKADALIPEVEKNARWEARQKAERQNSEYAAGKTMHKELNKSFKRQFE